VTAIRRIFLVLFSLSTLGALVLFSFSLSYSAMPVPATQETGSSTGNPGVVDPSAQESKNMNFTALAGSVITSAISLIGFFTTTVITWRKEKREASLADVERKKLEIELEKNKLELEELKKSKTKKKAKIEK
jgi:hypothetical protein